jgi:hypothetical protein
MEGDVPTIVELLLGLSRKELRRMEGGFPSGGGTGNEGRCPDGGVGNGGRMPGGSGAGMEGDVPTPAAVEGGVSQVNRGRIRISQVRTGDGQQRIFSQIYFVNYLLLIEKRKNR